MELKINPEYEALLPKLSLEKYFSLKNSIKADGLWHPLTVNSQGIILDGHNRFHVCVELGIEPSCEIRDFSDPLLEKKFVIESNLDRRHLNPFQMVELGLPLLAIEEELAKRRQGTRTDLGELPANSGRMFGNTRDIVSEKIGVKHSIFEYAKTVLELGSEDLKEKCRSGEWSISFAYGQIRGKPAVVAAKRAATELTVGNELEAEAKMPETADELEEASKLLKAEAKRKRAEVEAAKTPEQKAREAEDKVESDRQKAEQKTKKAEEKAAKKAAEEAEKNRKAEEKKHQDEERKLKEDEEREARENQIRKEEREKAEDQRKKDEEERKQKELREVSRVTLEEYEERLKTMRREDLKNKLKEECAQGVFIPLPEGKYRCLVIDPPWPMQKIEREVRPNQVKELDYPTMTLEEIADLPIPKLANEGGCHVYLWVTHRFLPDGLAFFEKWGVSYQCVLTWVKNVGFTPYSWMYSTEHVLFGRIGSLELLKLGKRLDTNAKRLDSNVELDNNGFIDNLMAFNADVREHSRKPDIFYTLVKEVSPKPRLDMFSREKREGFIPWGNEVNKFNAI